MKMRHNKLSDIRKGLKMLSKDSKKKKPFSDGLSIALQADKKVAKVATPKQDVWVVATVIEGAKSDGDDSFADIIGIYTSATKARKICDMVKERKYIKNLNYDLLPDFDTCGVFCRELNQTLTTAEDEE
jgi:ribosomal protein L22